MRGFRRWGSLRGCWRSLGGGRGKTGYDEMAIAFTYLHVNGIHEIEAGDSRSFHNSPENISVQEIPGGSIEQRYRFVRILNNGNVAGI